VVVRSTVEEVIELRAVLNKSTEEYRKVAYDSECDTYMDLSIFLFSIRVVIRGPPIVPHTLGIAQWVAKHQLSQTA